MSNIAQHFISYHPIELTSKKIEPIQIGKKSDAASYAFDLVEKVLASADQREYRFPSATTEVHEAVKRMAGEKNCGNDAQIIAERLLRQEQSAQERVNKLGIQMQKGSLFQVVFRKDGVEMMLIAKVDSHPFLDEEDFQRHAGLPFEKRVLKTCLMQFDARRHVRKVTLTCKNNAEYWWGQFLELEAVITNEENTKNAFLAIDDALSKRLKASSPADFTHLRRNVVSYFQTQRNFNMEDFTEYAFGTYKPLDKEVNMEKLRASIAALPEKKGFDASFDVVQDAVKRRFKRVIELTDKIKLELAEDAQDMGNSIEAREIAGKKGVFIRSDEGYETFKRRQ